MLHPFVMLLAAPLAAGLLGYLVGRLRNELTFIGAMAVLFYAIRMFIASRSGESSLVLLEQSGFEFALRLDQLSGFVLLLAAAFSTMILLYSFRYMRGRDGTRGYYLYAMLVLVCTNGVILAANLVTLLFFWGGLLVMLYAILLVGHGDRPKTAGKALLIVGLSDFAMMLGIALLLVRDRWTLLAPATPMPLTDGHSVLAFVLIAAAALAKAGSMPLHTWIPAAADTAPAPVMALIPASLDKLLGIYLLTRLSVNMFTLAGNVALRNVLMSAGAVTVLAAVSMALVQKRMMRLLSFHAVSQVGYMVLGIGTGSIVGIAGGLFHMVNHAMYKSGLFLAAGSVEHWTRSDELDRLGGLARQMPLTFASFLVFALSIAGVPPLNGFASKWMVYQGIIDAGRAGNHLFPFYLVCAMLGSVLTLASFLKLLHAVFLGRRPAHLAKVRDVPITMWLPTVLLALACVAFGVFYRQIPLNGLVLPALPFHGSGLAGIWQPEVATSLLLAGLGLGAVIYLLGTAGRPVSGRTFVGGESIADEEESRVPGTAFYSPVKKLPVVGELLDFGGRGAFDLANWISGTLRGFGRVFRDWVDRVLQVLVSFTGELVWFCGIGLSRLQNGSLPLYVGWVFIGAIVFFLAIFLGS